MMTPLSGKIWRRSPQGNFALFNTAPTERGLTVAAPGKSASVREKHRQRAVAISEAARPAPFTHPTFSGNPLAGYGHFQYGSGASVQASQIENPTQQRQGGE
jgi:hypothetical protein